MNMQIDWQTYLLVRLLIYEEVLALGAAARPKAAGVATATLENIASLEPCRDAQRYELLLKGIASEIM